MAWPFVVFKTITRKNAFESVEYLCITRETPNRRLRTTSCRIADSSWKVPSCMYGTISYEISYGRYHLPSYRKMVPFTDNTQDGTFHGLYLRWYLSRDVRETAWCSSEAAKWPLKVIMHLSRDQVFCSLFSNSYFYPVGQLQIYEQALNGKCWEL